MSTTNQTQARIVSTALNLLLAHGIKKTTVEDVSDNCGITRATVYRYYKDKKNLVKTCFMHMVDILQVVFTELDKHKNYDTHKSAEQIRLALKSLPRGDLPARVNELKSLYPDIFTEYQKARLSTIREVYKRMFDVAKKDGLLFDSETDWDLVQTILSEATFYVADSPLIQSSGLSFGQIYTAIMDIMLYGVVGRRK